MIIRRLLKWHNRLPNNPQFDSSIEVFQSHGGYGIRATRDLSRSQTIVRVPASGWRDFSAEQSTNEARRSNPQFYDLLCNISTTLVPNSPEHSDNLLRSSCLATKLIIDKQEKLVHPYVEFLNQASFPGNPSILPHPLVMSADAFQGTECVLTGSSSNRAITKRREIYNYIGESLFGVGNDMVPEFKWAMGIVLSRAVSNTALGMPLTLVPVLDLVNHSNEGHNAEHNYNRMTGEFSLITTKPVLAGEEVFINYGDGRDTASFMSLYGFYEMGNKNDQLSFQLKATVHGCAIHNLAAKTVNSPDQDQEQLGTLTDWIQHTSKKHSVRITAAAAQKKSDDVTDLLPAANLADIMINGASGVSLYFLLSLDKTESAEIIGKLLKHDAGSTVESERRLQLCEAVVAATHGALRGNLLGRARAVAASHAAAMDLTSSDDTNAIGAGRDGVVEKEIFSARLILEAVDKSLVDMLANDHELRAKDLSFGGPETLMAAEERLKDLLLIASKSSESDFSAVPSAENALLQWRSSCAAVSANELDGLIRLKLFCTAYHIALLSSL